MNEKLIKQLREGTIAVENDGTLDDLIKILQYAFPNDKCKIFGDCKYYSKLYYTEGIWAGKNIIDLPTYSVKEFLTQEKQVEIYFKGNLIKTCNSVSECATYLNYSISFISKAIKSKRIFDNYQVFFKV